MRHVAVSFVFLSLPGVSVANRIYLLLVGGCTSSHAFGWRNQFGRYLLMLCGEVVGVHCLLYVFLCDVISDVLVLLSDDGN